MSHGIGACVLLFAVSQCSHCSVDDSHKRQADDASVECAAREPTKAVVKSENALLQLQVLRSVTNRANRTFSSSCCKSCGGKPFCSPYSRNCYQSKSKDYYETCAEHTAASCCNSCNSAPFCSPYSRNCYQSKSKDYYETCAEHVNAIVATDGHCCDNCAGLYPFCSPNSGSCYGSKEKEDYVGCTTTTTTPCAETSWWFKAAAFQTIAITEMSLEELYAYLDTLEKYGTRVIGLNVGYFNGPLAMWGGLAMNDPFEVNKVFGSTEEFDKFVSTAHNKGMRVISWMNPSYWWTGSKYVKQAERDMRAIRDNGQDWKIDLPASSPARWFQWSSFRSGKSKPADDGSYASYPGEVFNWIWDPDAGFSYLSHWADQPMVDFNSPEFQKEWKRILKYWIIERGLDGFVYDAPDRYLGVETGALEQRFYDEQGIAAGQFKKVITDPARELSCQFAQLAEGYGDQHEMVVFGLSGVLQSEWNDRFQAWGDIVEGIKGKDPSKIEQAFVDYDKLLRTNKASNYNGILWQRHHNLPFGEQDPARNALARAVAVAGGYLTAVEDPGRAWEWYQTNSNQRWWEADPYTGTESVLQDLANAMENCEVFAHGTEREQLAVDSTCCDKCTGQPFCSPYSGTCYDEKRRDYYMTCGDEATKFTLLGNGRKLYAVRRYVTEGATGLAIFNLEGSSATVTIKVPAQFQGRTVSDCASNVSGQSPALTDAHTVNIPAYGFKMLRVME